MIPILAHSTTTGPEVALTLIIGGGLILLWSGFMHSCGTHNGKQVKEEEAVKDGVGEYYIDENNDKAFRWKKLS
jgi:hypothetical protein